MPSPLTISPTSLPVHIPDELAQYVMQETEVCGKYLTKRDVGNKTHRKARYLGFYLLLKAEAPESGWIKNYTKQLPQLSENFGISQRTFFTYIAELERLQLAFREGKDIRIVGWAELGRILNIDTKKRTKIQFNYDGKQKIHWWFAALEIQSNQDAQAYMIWKKLHKNSEQLNTVLTALLQRRFNPEKINNPEYLSGALLGLAIEDFQTGTEVHDILVNIRADVNRSVFNLGEAWEMSPQLVCYWKKKMADQQIIGRAKLRVTSHYTKETKESHQNPHCHVLWNDKLKERVWFLCEQITVVMPWKWSEFVEKLEKKLAA